jgi:hypothetical protein
MTERSENRPLPKETSKGLPVVSSSTTRSIWENYTTRESWGEHLTEVQQRLVDENPELVAFMESQVGRFPSQLHIPIFEVLVGTIAFLEHQAEANRFSSMFDTSPEVDPETK